MGPCGKQSRRLSNVSPACCALDRSPATTNASGRCRAIHPRIFASVRSCVDRRRWKSAVNNILTPPPQNHHHPESRLRSRRRLEPLCDRCCRDRRFRPPIAGCRFCRPTRMSAFESKRRYHATICQNRHDHRLAKSNATNDSIPSRPESLAAGATPDPKRVDHHGYLNSRTSGSVSLELVMWVWTAEAPLKPCPAPAPPQIVS